MKKLFALWMFVLVSALVWANPAELIDQGRFREAYNEAIAADGSAKSYAFAAMAASYYATHVAKTEKEKESWYAKAESAAKKAIDADPQSPDGYFELARAQGRLALYRGILASLNLASSVRDNLKKAISLDPQYGAAYMALAMWNLEIAQKGVGWMYGASLKRVEPLFQKAIQLDPEVIPYRVQFAKALVRLKKPAAARKQYEKALTIPARTWLDRVYQDQARKGLEGLK